MNQSPISIVTINFNNANGLRRTIASIANQTHQPLDYIVIDGASTDDSVSIIKSAGNTITAWQSEPDNGISDAFNKGTALCNGRIVLFLNSGDTLFSPDTLFQISTDYAKHHWNWASGISVVTNPDGKPIGRYHPTPGTWKLTYKNTMSHQATFVDRSLLIQNPFDIKLHQAMDYDLWLRLHFIHHIPHMCLNITVSNFESGGRSTNLKSLYDGIFYSRRKVRQLCGKPPCLTDIMLRTYLAAYKLAWVAKARFLSQ